MTINRKDARSALSEYLKTNLTKTQSVYGYQVADFNGASPVVYVTSSGSDRKKITGMGVASTFQLNIHIFVLYPTKPDVTYTEATAEDLLDDIEAEIANACFGIRNHDLIKAISYSEPSNADGVADLSGETYLHEIVSVNVTCF
jgi:hypothetical protein